MIDHYTCKSKFLVVIMILALLIPQYSRSQSRSCNQAANSSQQNNACYQNSNYQHSNECHQAVEHHQNSELHQNANCNQNKNSEPIGWEIAMKEIHNNDPARRNYSDEQKTDLDWITRSVCERSHEPYTNRNPSRSSIQDDNIKIHINEDYIGYFKPRSVLFVDANEKITVLISNRKGRVLLYRLEAGGIDMKCLAKGKYYVSVYDENMQLLKKLKIRKQAS